MSQTDPCAPQADPGAPVKTHHHHYGHLFFAKRRGIGSFRSLAMAIGAGFLLNCSMPAADAPQPVPDPYRPRFHFTPPAGWMNDPCGMFYYEGEYHLHYLSNPDPAGWGKQWAHLASQDLVHWAPWPASIRCSGSGSGLVDSDNTAGFQTGADRVPVLVYSDFADEGQIVGLAFSHDRGRTWRQYPHNPVLRRPDGNKDFRDPKVVWYAPSRKWLLVLSRGYHPPGNLFESTDLKKWKLLGEMPNGECPDLFELPIAGRPAERKWVYVAGSYPTTPNGEGINYWLGDFDGKSFSNRSAAGRFGGNFFVGQSFSQVPAADGRRLWIGWKWLPAEKYGALGPWTGGIQTIPVALALRDLPGTGLRLCYQPVKELQALRDGHTQLPPQIIKEGSLPVGGPNPPGELLEIIARFQLDTAAEFGFRLRQGPAGPCTVGYRTAKQEVFFTPPAGQGGIVQPLAPRGQEVQLHILLDRSVVDIFGNDGLTWNCEFFKADPQSLGLELYASGGVVQLLALDLWRLKSE